MKIATIAVSGRTTALRVEVTETAAERMRGLLGRIALDVDAGLLLRRCWAIHTFGMRMPIDVVFLGRDLRVLAIHRQVGRRRMLCRPGASAVLELASGGACHHGMTVDARCALGPPP